MYLWDDIFACSWIYRHSLWVGICISDDKAYKGGVKWKLNFMDGGGGVLPVICGGLS
jgi:hypothetical protein